MKKWCTEYGEDQWKIWPWYLETLTLALGPKSLLTSRVKADIALHGNLISELRDVNCHMGSHSVTCHPTQVNAPCLTTAMQAGTQFTYPRGMEGWVDLVDLIASRPGVEPATFRSRVQRPTNVTTIAREVSTTVDEAFGVWSKKSTSFFRMIINSACKLFLFQWQFIMFQLHNCDVCLINIYYWNHNHNYKSESGSITITITVTKTIKCDNNQNNTTAGVLLLAL